MTTRTIISGCHPLNRPATMRAMSTTPITDGIHQALNHAVEAEMDVDEGWMCVPEIHVSQITWKILSDEFDSISSKPAERPLEDGVLGYIRGYPVKPLKYGQGWTIIYRETQTTDKKRMN